MCHLTSTGAEAGRTRVHLDFIFCERRGGSKGLVGCRAPCPCPYTRVPAALPFQSFLAHCSYCGVLCIIVGWGVLLDMVPVLAALDSGDPSPHFHVTDPELPSCSSTPAGDAPDLKGHSLKTSNKPSLVSTAALK